MQLPAIIRQPSDAVLGPSGEIVSKAAVSAMGVDGWWQFNPVHEPWSGAFQQGYEPDRQQSVLAFSAVFACVSLRANDIAKLRLRLMEWNKAARIWEEIENAAYSPVLRKPNRYQTRIQFLKQWLTSKLLRGNTYVLKERDNRSVVRGLYVLDPNRVLPLVTDDGAVYYQVGADPLSGFNRDMPAVPASEIIHDRGLCPYHPLVGVSAIYACGMSAAQGNRIQTNSNRHFGNQSRPGGILTAPGQIDDVTAARLKQQVEEATSGVNVGRLLVAGNGLKYEAIGMTAVDSQLIEQLQWTVEDVARAFLVPISKLAVVGAAASAKSSAQDDLFYYKQTLQIDLEEIEALLDDGLRLGPDFGNAYGVDLDVDGLLRMDRKSRAEAREIDARAGMLSPNEGRQQEDLPPVTGGESPMAQQQNYSLAALAKRDARDDPFATSSGNPAPSKADAEAAEAEARTLIETIQKGFAHA